MSVEERRFYYGPFHDYVFLDADLKEEYDPVINEVVTDYRRAHRDEGDIE